MNASPSHHARQRARHQPARLRPLAGRRHGEGRNPARPGRRRAAISQPMRRHGFDSFDMADHYGSAEIITGRLLKRSQGAAAQARGLHQMVP